MNQSLDTDGSKNWKNKTYKSVLIPKDQVHCIYLDSWFSL